MIRGAPSLGSSMKHRSESHLSLQLIPISCELNQGIGGSTVQEIEQGLSVEKHERDHLVWNRENRVEVVRVAYCPRSPSH